MAKILAAVVLSTACAHPPVLPVREAFSSDSSEMTRIEAINKSGALDRLDLNLLDESAFKVLSEELAPVTKLGVIRSREPGKFFLQVRRGLFDKYLNYPEWNIPLRASDENKVLKFSEYLNDLVILRGITGEKDSLEVRLIMPAPSLSFVTDLVTRGRVTGTVYDQFTKVPLRDAALSLRAANGNLFHATSKYDGRYSFFRLPAGRYSLLVEKAGYPSFKVAEILVRDYHNSQTFISMGSPPVVTPSAVPTIAPSPLPSIAPSAKPSSPVPLPSIVPTPCPANPLVWVNTSSGVYHYPSSIWYGTTRKGAFMNESEAKAKGYHPSKLS